MWSLSKAVNVAYTTKVNLKHHTAKFATPKKLFNSRFTEGHMSSIQFKKLSREILTNPKSL